ECRKVGRHGVVCEVAPDDLRQPAPLFGDRLMHSPPQLLLYLPELYPHAIAPGFPFKLELALARPPTDEHEAQELEGSRLSQPTLHASLRGQRGGIVRSCSLGGLRINDQLELGRRCTGRLAASLIAARPVSRIALPDSSKVRGNIYVDLLGRGMGGARRVTLR